MWVQLSFLFAFYLVITATNVSEELVEESADANVTALLRDSSPKLDGFKVKRGIVKKETKKTKDKKKEKGNGWMEKIDFNTYFKIVREAVVWVKLIVEFINAEATDWIKILAIVDDLITDVASIYEYDLSDCPKKVKDQIADVTNATVTKVTSELDKFKKVLVKTQDNLIHAITSIGKNKDKNPTDASNAMVKEISKTTIILDKAIKDIEAGTLVEFPKQITNEVRDQFDNSLSKAKTELVKLNHTLSSTKTKIIETMDSMASIDTNKTAERLTNAVSNVIDVLNKTKDTLGVGIGSIDLVKLKIRRARGKYDKNHELTKLQKELLKTKDELHNLKESLAEDTDEFEIFDITIKKDSELNNWIKRLLSEWFS